MNIEIKNKFPEWCASNENFDLVLGDDSDSVLVSNFLEMETWNSTRYFYDFEMLYIEKGHEHDNKMVGCDIDFTINDKMRCWSNHVTAISSKDTINTSSANLNNIYKINSRNYTDKYAGSTFNILLGYFEYDVSQLSEQARMLLMCIDSSYLGFYSKKFHPIQKKWLVDILNLPELYDTILRHDEQDFIDLAMSLNIKIPTGKKNKYGKEIYRDGKIWINDDGFLETEIDLEGISNILGLPITLPTCQFEPFLKDGLTLKIGYANTKFIQRKDQIDKNIFSYSQTYTDSASYTYLVQKSKN